MKIQQFEVGMKVVVNDLPDATVYTVAEIEGFNAKLTYECGGRTLSGGLGEFLGGAAYLAFSQDGGEENCGNVHHSWAVRRLERSDPAQLHSFPGRRQRLADRRLAARANTRKEGHAGGVGYGWRVPAGNYARCCSELPCDVLF